jgi:hypothetical protein
MDASLKINCELRVIEKKTEDEKEGEIGRGARKFYPNVCSEDQRPIPLLQIVMLASSRTICREVEDRPLAGLQGSRSTATER